MVERPDIQFRMTVEGGRGAEAALGEVIRASSPAGIKANFIKVVDLGLRKVVERTPGKTRRLAGGWTKEEREDVTPGSFRYEARIFNRLAGEGVTYQSTDGTTKPKLRTFPSDEQQTYGEVIAILDRGGKRHVITPKRKKFLSWWGYQPGRNPKTGRYQIEGLFPVFAKKVNHPGHPAFGMLTQTGKELLQLARSIGNEVQAGVVNAWDVSSGKGR